MELPEVDMLQITGAVQGYFVSRDGRVFSSRRGLLRELKGSLDSNGYKCVKIRLEGERGQVTKAVHILVLENFTGPRPEGDIQGAHDDGNRLNNAHSNLFWKTRLENAKDKIRHGTSAAGNLAARPPIPKAVKNEIRALRENEGISLYALARRFSIKQNTAKYICAGLPYPEKSGPFRGRTWEEAAETWLRAEGIGERDFVRPIPGMAEGYLATRDGRVLSSRTGKLRELRPSSDKKGYLHVQVRPQGERGSVSVAVHLLVLITFAGPKPDPSLEGCHDDGNNRNNAASNLYWGTREQNNRQKREHGTMPLGESHHAAKLTQAKVREMRRLNASGQSYQSLARSYGMNHVTVKKICTGALWPDTPMEQPAPAAPRGNSKLTKDQVDEFRRRKSQGESYALIAESAGLHRSVVRDLCTKKTWNCLPTEFPPPLVVAASEQYGELAPNSKLAAGDVTAMRAERAAGDSWVGIGRRRGVHANTAKNACLGRTWKKGCATPTHEEPFKRLGTKGRCAGSSVFGSRLTDEVVFQMRLEHLAGGTYRGLGRKYGVGNCTAKQAISGKTWSHVPMPPRGNSPIA